MRIFQRTSILFCSAALLLAQSALAAADAQPSELAVDVGGFLGASYRLTLDSGGLVCVETVAGRSSTVGRKRPTDEEWRVLRAKLDKLNVWAWRASYVDANAMDGTQWSIRILYPDKAIVSRGSNSYPDDSGSQRGSAEESPEFKEFRAAFIALIPQCRL